MLATLVCTTQALYYLVKTKKVNTRHKGSVFTCLLLY